MHYVPTYKEISEIDYWQPPQPASLMLMITTLSGKKFNIDMLPDLDDEGFFNESVPHPIIPRHIYINDKQLPLRSREEGLVLTLLSQLIENNRLGPNNRLAEEMIAYFTTEKS